MTTQTNIIVKNLLKKNPNSLDCANLYIMGATVFYPCVHTPKTKYESKTEKEYSITIFVDEEAKDKLLDEVLLNKTFAQVGKDKTSKPPRRIKFPLSSQTDDKVNYDIVEGMYGFTVSKNAISKQGNETYVTVKDTENNDFKQDIGNGSVCNIKLFGYRNKEGQLVVQLDTVQVVKHVPFEKGEGGATATDDVLGITYGGKDKENKPASQAPSVDAAITDDDLDSLPF